MEFLSLVASTTKRRPIVSEEVTSVAEMPAFANTDALQGKITVVAETSDPTAPTAAVPINTSSGIALTDGNGVVYAAAGILGVLNSNELNFTMMVQSDALLSALALSGRDYVDAFFEVRVTQGAQDLLLLKEPVIIEQVTALGAGPPPTNGGSISDVGLWYRPEIGDDVALAAWPTAGHEPNSRIDVLYSGGLRAYRIVGGAANPADPGQVAPNDYNAFTNNVHWERML
jgi:hypothetical protein